MTTNSRKAFLAATVAVLLGGTGLSGCNTVEGVGQDVEDLGDAVGDEAREERRRQRD
jgi:predicted small secreted protein